MLSSEEGEDESDEGKTPLQSSGRLEDSCPGESGEMQVGDAPRRADRKANGEPLFRHLDGPLLEKQFSSDSVKIPVCSSARVQIWFFKAGQGCDGLIGVIMQRLSWSDPVDRMDSPACGLFIPLEGSSYLHVEAAYKSDSG